MESLTKTEALEKINEILTAHFDVCCETLIKGLTQLIHEKYYLTNQKFATIDILAGFNPMNPKGILDLSLSQDYLRDLLFLWKTISPKNKYENLHKCTKNYNLYIKPYDVGTYGEAVAFSFFDFGKTKTLKRLIPRVQEGLQAHGIKISFKGYKGFAIIMRLIVTCNIQKDYRP